VHALKSEKVVNRRLKDDPNGSSFACFHHCGASIKLKLHRLFVRIRNLILGKATKIYRHIPVLVKTRTTIQGTLLAELHAFLEAAMTVGNPQVNLVIMFEVRGQILAKARVLLRYACIF
jgi:hypothetical protein